MIRSIVHHSLLLFQSASLFLLLNESYITYNSSNGGGSCISWILIRKNLTNIVPSHKSKTKFVRICIMIRPLQFVESTHPSLDYSSYIIVSVVNF